MSISVTLGQTTKRKNSTCQTITNGKTYQCTLKENTSIYNPIFQMFISDDIMNTPYNYLKFENKFYWIQDIVSIGNNQYDIHCKIDVLASYKAEILTNEVYIKYSSNKYREDLPDARLTQKSAVSTQISYMPVEWGMFGGITNDELSGYYCVTYIGDKGSLFIYLTESQLTKLTNRLQSTDVITQLGDSVGKAMGDTGQCITSCKYIHHINENGQARMVLPNGTDLDIIGKVSKRTDSGTTYLPIPWQYPLNDFRNRSEFTKLVLKLPFYGVIQIPVEQVFGLSEITINYSCDCVTGDWVYMISELGDQKFSCNVSFDVQLSTSSSPSLLNTVGSIIGGVAESVSGVGAISASGGSAGWGTFVSGIAHIGSGIMSSYAITPSSVGGNTTVAGIDADISSFRMTSFTHAPIVDLEEHRKKNGRPCYNYYPLNECLGYVECVVTGVSNIKAPQIIQLEICEYLNSGIYIE